jgi:hypothetical protein
VKEWEAGNPGEGKGVDAYFRTDSVHFASSAVDIILARLDSKNQRFWPDRWSEIGAPADKANEKLAYTLARQWLEAIGVDVGGLERKYPVEITQDVCRAKGEGLVSPNFHVRWEKRGPRLEGEVSLRKAEVALDTSRRWLVELRVAEMASWSRPVISISNAYAIARLPDAPVHRYFKAHGGEAWTNVLSLLAISPERRRQGLKQMLAEAQSLVSLLGIEDQIEVEPGLLQEAFVNPPAFGVGGSLDFGHRQFRFGTNGCLTYLSYYPRTYTNHSQWMRLPPTISSNQALGIALEKARAISLDTDRLDRDHARRFYRLSAPERVKEKGKTRLLWLESPGYAVEWLSRTQPAGPPVLQVIVYADVARIGSLRINDTSYWGRPPILVRLPER